MKHHSLESVFAGNQRHQNAHRKRSLQIRPKSAAIYPLG
jgi:hypothetical protein